MSESTPTLIRALPTENTGTDQFMRHIAGTPLLTRDEEYDLARRVAQGDQDAKNAFIEANLRLVVSVAKRYKWLSVPLDDLIQEGTIGLIHAVEKYDPDTGFRFSSYATWWIKQAIRRAGPVLEQTIRLPVHVEDERRALLNVSASLEEALCRKPSHAEIAQATGKTVKRVQFYLQQVGIAPFSLDVPMTSAFDESDTLANLLPDPDACDPQEVVEQVDEHDFLVRMLTKLPARQADVLRRRHGIDCERQTLEQVADAYSVVKERVRQIEVLAMRRLNEVVRKEFEKVRGST